MKPSEINFQLINESIRLNWDVFSSKVNVVHVQLNVSELPTLELRRKSFLRVE
jgi:hypothetical protein